MRCHRLHPQSYKTIFFVRFQKTSVKGCERDPRQAVPLLGKLAICCWVLLQIHT